MTKTKEPDILVIEDIRNFNFPCVYARNETEAEHHLFRREWREIWWDFDLGLLRGSPNTQTLARKLEVMGSQDDILGVERMVIHTMNPTGRRELVAALSPYYPIVVVDANLYLAQGEVPMVYIGDAE